MYQYDNFDLDISEQNGSYRVKVNHPQAGQGAELVTLPVDDECLTTLIGKNELDVLSPKEIGEALYRAFFQGKIAEQFAISLHAVNQRRHGLRLRLHLDDTPQLARLPWEYLYHPVHHFIALSHLTPIVRYLHIPQPEVRPTITGPFNILVILSSPTDQARLDVEEEWQQLTQEFAPLRKSQRAHLERLLSCSGEDMRSSLLSRLRRGALHAIHFVGHGDFAENGEYGYLCFEDKDKKTEPITADDFALLLNGHQIQLVYLNTCRSGLSGMSNPFAGVAQQLARINVPAVVAMSMRVSDTQSRRMAGEFYRALVQDNYSVDAALAEARKAIYHHDENHEWGKLILFMRSSDGRLFDIRYSTVDETPHSTPRPDADIKNLDRSAPLWAIYPFDATGERDVAFSPGIVWGLSRGSYIGVLSTTTANQSVDGVFMAEQLLYDLSHKTGPNAMSLPRRWWLTVEWQRYFNGPLTPYDIWDAAHRSLQREYIFENGFPPTDLLGLILTIDVPNEYQARQHIIDIIRNWITQVYKSIFPDRDVAFLIQCIHPSLLIAQQFANLITEQSNTSSNTNQAAALLVPIEHFFNVPVEGVVAKSSSQSNKQTDLRSMRGRRIVGESFCRLFEHIVLPNNSKQAELNYPSLFSIYLNYIRDLPIADDETLHFDAEFNGMMDVVRDMDHISTKEGYIDCDTDTDERLFVMVREYRPALLYNLVKAYACSKRPEARLLALRFACQPLLDDSSMTSKSQEIHPGAQILIDAWLEKSYEDLKDPYDENVRYLKLDLRIKRNQPALSIPLLLAMLRFAQRHKMNVMDSLNTWRKLADTTPEQSNGDGDYINGNGEHLDRQLDMLPPALQDVVHLLEGTLTESDFWARAIQDEQHLLYVMKTGLNLPPPDDLRAYARLDFPEFWWWIQTLNPTSELITELLKLPSDERAVLGLLTAEERHSLHNDREMAALLIRCRRRPNIYYAI